MRRLPLPVPFVLAAAVALLAALWGGLLRVGWVIPPLMPAWVGRHGLLMVGGFFGTLISLERAAALAALFRLRWPYAAPALSALGGLGLLLGLPLLPARGLLALGSLGLVLIFLDINRRQRTLPHLLMGLGALFWLGGNLLSLFGQPVAACVPWWAAFLVVTIVGERLELARLLRPSRLAVRLLLGGVGVLGLGLLLSLFAFDIGQRAAGAGLAALGAWLLRYDLARHTALRGQTGQTRFSGVCLLSGYVWLALAGGLWLWWGGSYSAGPVYDALLHSLLVGFVFAMIFGHAPIILPALAGLPLTHTPLFYLPLALLHAGLVVRVGGDLLAQPAARRWGALLNVTAILLFLVLLGWAVRRARSTAPGDTA